MKNLMICKDCRK